MPSRKCLTTAIFCHRLICLVKRVVYCSWNTKTDRIFCYFGPLFVLLTPPHLLWSQKSKFWKKMKKCLEILSFYIYTCTINEDHIMMYGSWKTRCDRQFFVTLGYFLIFQSPDNPENQNFKVEKNTWRYHFTHLHYKWQSCNVWFLKYGAHQTKFLLFWTVYCHFTSLSTQKIKIFKKWKKHLKTLSFYKYVP